MVHQAKSNLYLIGDLDNITRATVIVSRKTSQQATIKTKEEQAYRRGFDDGVNAIREALGLALLPEMDGADA